MKVWSGWLVFTFDFEDFVLWDFLRCAQLRVTNIQIIVETQSRRGCPGTLAACCKPSSGAGVGWMDTLLIRPDSNSGQKNGDRIKESYQSASLPGRRPAGSRKNASLRSRFASATTNHRGQTWSARSRVRSPRTPKIFRPFFTSESRGNDDINTSCAYSALVASKSL